MGRMKASDLLVKCLEEEGIEYIFGVPGEENADFMMALEKSEKIRFILTRHEQGAAFMAEGIVTLAGSRMYTSMADTDDVIDDALSRFDRVLEKVGS